MKHNLLCQVILWALLLARGGWAETVPLTFNYQGQLKDGQGVIAPAGNYTLTFRIFDAEAGGHLIWGRSQIAAVDDYGFFNVLIGEGGNALTAENPKVSNMADVFTGDTRGSRWLEIQVSGAKPFSKRQRLTSMPYAFLTANAAQSAGNFPVGGTMTVAGSTTVSGKVVVADHAVLNGPLTVTGHSAISNALLSDVSTDFQGESSVEGPVTMAHDLEQKGFSTFMAPVVVSNTLTIHQPLAWFGAMTKLKSQVSDTSFPLTQTNDGFYVANFFRDGTRDNTDESSIKTQSATFYFKTHFYIMLAGDDFNYYHILTVPAKKGTEVAFSVNSHHKMDLYWRPMYK